MPKFHPVARGAALTVAIAAAVSVPASSAPSSVPETQVWIDVATHDVAGMPDLGILGGLAGRMMGGSGPQGYPQSRNIPASPGKLLDVAMHNRLRPGAEAEQFVPSGLGLGKSLPLSPPPGKPVQEDKNGETPDIQVTVRQYWGCGAKPRAGQPKTITLKVKGGRPEATGSLAPGLFVPDRDIDVNSSYALWPNLKNRKRTSDRSSLVGQHRIAGDGVPESLKFELGQEADFMPKITLDVRGELADSIQLRWEPVERARAYFISAMAMQDERNVVVWSSSEVAGAGNELLNYLTGPYIDKWLKQKVLLSPSIANCVIPQGIFKPAGSGVEGGGMASLDLIAYGPETNIAWPPRPVDPKQPWDPEWNVRVRTKSTASAMLGMDLGAAATPPDSEEQLQPQEKESKGKKLLKGLLRNF